METGFVQGEGLREEEGREGVILIVSVVLTVLVLAIHFSASAEQPTQRPSDGVPSQEKPKP